MRDRTRSTQAVGLTLAEVRHRGIVQVGGQIAQFDDLALPQSPNGVSWRREMAASWVGPRRWLLIGTRANAEHWLSIETPATMRVDLSQGRAIFRLTGDWRELLSHGCPLDQERAFPRETWSCAQSVFDEVPVFLLSPGHHRWIEIFAPRSYGSFLWEILCEHGRTRGGRIGEPILSVADFCEP